MAAGQTIVIYGEMAILNCLTRRFEQEAVYDDSGTDLLYFKFTIRVVGYFTGQFFGSSDEPRVHISPSSANQSAADHQRSTRYLFRPRQPFTMLCGASVNSSGVSGGTPLLIAEPFVTTSSVNPTHKDLENGPKVRVIDITQISGDSVFRGEFEFEVCKIECDSLGNCPNSSGVLNNRWGVTDEIDHNMMTTRTYNGRLRMSVGGDVNPNTFRQAVVPPLQPGLRRESMKFVASEDGRQLLYEIVDREIAYSVPPPATTWRLSHTESAERAGELGFYSEVSVSLGGDRNVDKRRLIVLAASIAHVKILHGVRDAAVMLQSVSVTDEYSDDSSLIHLHVKARRTAAPELTEFGGGIFGIGIGSIGKPLTSPDLQAVGWNTSYDNNRSRGGYRESQVEVEGPVQLVGAFLAYLQNPCSNQHAISGSSVSANASTQSHFDKTSVEVRIAGEIPDDGSLQDYSSANAEGMYSHYQLESTYRTNGVVAHLPVATPTSLGGEPLPGADTAVFVNLAPSLTERVIRVSAERVGLMPRPPNPGFSFVDQNGITNRLIRRNVRPSTGEITPDNKRTYRLECEFIYGLSRTPSDGDLLIAGANAWEKNGGLYGTVFSRLSEESVAQGGITRV